MTTECYECRGQSVARLPRIRARRAEDFAQHLPAPLQSDGLLMKRLRLSGPKGLVIRAKGASPALRTRGADLHERRDKRHEKIEACKLAHRDATGGRPPQQFLWLGMLRRLRPAIANSGHSSSRIKRHPKRH